MSGIKRSLPLAFVLVGTLILLTLGTWQMKRLAWKNDLIAARDAGLNMPPVELPTNIEDAEHYDFRPVTLVGKFRHDLEQLYGVEARNGVFGHHLLTPLARTEGPMVLVNRGWVPADRTSSSSRSEGLMEGVVQVNGISRYRLDDLPGWFTPDNDPAAGHWYHYDLSAMEKALNVSLAPLVVEADSTPNPGGLPEGGRALSKLVNNHLQYAVTWYGLAITLIGVYIVFRRQQN